MQFVVEAEEGDLDEFLVEVEVEERKVVWGGVPWTPGVRRPRPRTAARRTLACLGTSCLGAASSSPRIWGTMSFRFVYRTADISVLPLAET